MSWLDYFKKKKKLIQENEYLTKMLKLDVHRSLKSIQKLEQGATYYIYIEDACDKDLQLFKETLKSLGEQINWTIPSIIFTNRAIKKKKIKKKKNAAKKK